MFSMWNWVGLVLCAAVAIGSEDEWREVTIAQGPVRGHRDANYDIYTFYNIPYATAPTGVDKFKAPMEGPVWTEVFDAVDRGIICPQPGAPTAVEDCLVANVFVPDTNEINLPVVINVHGGAFQYGHGSIFTFKALVDTKKIIEVNFNYRLGAHGFLCLRTEKAPGNAGIKDQIALLRWVKANIASFGGNPEEVILVGCSAGAGSVDLLTLSPATTGLFKRAIIESGAVIGAVGLQVDPIANAKTYATLFNVSNVDDMASLEAFYTTASFTELLARPDAISNNKDASVLFAPCIEADLGQESVIEDTPMNIITSGNYTKIPLLYGYTNYDGQLRAYFWNDWKDKMNENFADFLPKELIFEDETIKNEVAEHVKVFYFGDQPVSENNIETFIHYFTDVMFGYPMLRTLTARIESLGDTIYLFKYSFTDDNTPGVLGTELRGASHCSQIIAVIDSDKTNATEEFLQMKAISREYWLNFILTGNPSQAGSSLPLWTPASANRSPHLSLEPGPTVQLKGQLIGDRAAFWDTIYDQYFVGPQVPGDSGGSRGPICNILIVTSLLLYSIYLSLL